MAVKRGSSGRAGNARGGGDIIRYDVYGASGSGVCVPVAPVFADFSGKRWEATYPSVLRAYYGAMSRFGVRWYRGDGTTGNSEVDMGCGAAWAGLRDDVGAYSAGVAGGAGGVGRCGTAAAVNVCLGHQGFGDGGPTVGLVGDVSTRGGEQVLENLAVDGLALKVDEDVDVVADVNDEVGRYVPPFKRGPKGGKSVGRGPNYLKNQAARERRAAAKCDRRSDDSGEGYVDKGKYSNKASFFDGLPREQVDELQRTRAEALLQKNLAEVTRQRTAAKRAAAEEQLLNLELESGAFENRIRTRNEAMDRRSQDQSENIEFYRNARGWAETVKSGEPSPKRGPSDVPSLSSGGSPRSESDWELEVKRRDDQNEALRKEVGELRKELETYEQSAYDPMKGSESVYEPCEYVMDGASRFDRDGFLDEFRQKDRARDFSVPLGTHIRPKEEVRLVGM